MAYTVYLGVVSKRLNSTYQPVHDTTWEFYSVTLKEETSIDTPVLLLNAAYATVAGYNYGIFQGRYYWISDVVAVRTNVIEVSMTLDYMATYKEAIQATSAFIEYGFNTEDTTLALEDSRIPGDLKPTQHTSTGDPFGGLINKNAGTYIVQAVGHDPRTPAISYHNGLMAFALDALDLQLLISSISPAIAADISSILANPGSLTPQDVLNQLTGYEMEQRLLMDSAFGAIQSVNWVPLSMAELTGASMRIYLGNYDTGVDGIVLNDHTPVVKPSTLTIPWPCTTLTDFKNLRCQMLLYLPFFGTIPIPVDKVIGISTLDIITAAQYTSGSMSIRVMAGNHTLFVGSTNIASSYGVGRSTVLATDSLSGSIQQLGGMIRVGTGVLDLGASVVGAAVGLGAGGISGAVGSIQQGVIDQLRGAAQQIQPTISSVGALGGAAAIGQSMSAELSLLYYGAYDFSAFRALYGHPVMKIATPAAGYCKTAGFSVAIPGHARYAALINATMDGGAFIE